MPRDCICAAEGRVIQTGEERVEENVEGVINTGRFEGSKIENWSHRIYSPCCRGGIQFFFWLLSPELRSLFISTAWWPLELLMVLLYRLAVVGDLMVNRLELNGTSLWPPKSAFQ